MPPRPAILLVGSRIVGRNATLADVSAIVDFQRRNRTFFAPYEPARSESFYTEEYWRIRVVEDEAARQADSAARIWLFPLEGDDRCVGQIGLTQIARGPFQACYFGFALDERLQGQGVMFEATRMVIRYAFEDLRLRRLMANHLPTNERSGRLLARLGFQVEGCAREYLKISGAWRDHTMTALINPNWRDEWLTP